MLIIQRNRTSPFGLLLSSKSGCGSGARRASCPLSTPKLSSLPSCPVLSTSLSSDHNFVDAKRARVTSAPFIRRKGDFTELGKAHGGLISPVCASGLLPSQPETASEISSQFPVNKPTQGCIASPIQDLFSKLEVSAIPFDTAIPAMPKAPQLSRRSPTSRPKMLPLQTGAYSPLTKSLAPPQIIFIASPELIYNWQSLATTTGVGRAAIAALLEPHRRTPPPGSWPALCISRTTEDEYMLNVHLPGFAPEMVTLSTRREDRLSVVADLWHAESNCHFEWLVTFSPRDANVSQTRANFSADGTLTIQVPRFNSNLYWRRSRLR